MADSIWSQCLFYLMEDVASVVFVFNYNNLCDVQSHKEKNQCIYTTVCM